VRYGKAAGLFVLAFALSAGVVLRSQQRSGTNGDVQRGRYLVEEVAKCAECHTPRNQNNELDRSRWLHGAPVWIQPVHPSPVWGQFAPTLAGLPSFTPEQIQRVLEMGQGVGGTAIEPPMHVYHMNHADALAITAYLKSLPAPKLQR
jgi:mono/diheme cytochrome c family protein